ncbi:MAG: hypothetical protein WEB79_04215 [Thermoleophilaceae bacterium]
MADAERRGGGVRGVLARAAAVALACGGALTGGCGGADTVTTDDPAVTFAPLVRIAADERHSPVSADWFIARSALWFADERCGHRKVAVGVARAAERTDATDWLYDFGLGRGPAYFRSPYEPGSCDDHSELKIYANQHTRPYDRLDRPPGLEPADGFFLDLRDSARNGQRGATEGDAGGGTVRVPAYVERHSEQIDGADGLRLTYWLLFSMHAPPDPEAARHEGDWERVDVLLRAGGRDGEYEPWMVRLRAGEGELRDVAWDRLDLAGGDGAHVLLETARGGHELAPARRGSCAGCVEWPTWKRLLSAPGQRWYGFGGAWGELGRGAGTTGPLGPHGEWAKDGGARELSAGWREGIVTPDPARAFAPLVRLHARERHFPLGTDDFTRHSMLTWGIEGCPVAQIAQGRGWPDDNVHGLPWLRADRLAGPAAYRLEPPARRCDRRFPRGYSTAEHTRPHDVGRPAALRPGDGFFLDIASHRYGGRRAVVRGRAGPLLTGVPVYFERRSESVDGAPGVRIAYWLLFAATKPRGGERTDLVSSEGGWERVSVLLRRLGLGGYLPASVRYHVRDGHTDVPWSDVERSATHPVALLARGSHAPYPTPGRRAWGVRADGRRHAFHDDASDCGACPRWRTWERLLPVREQPWWGYGGAWGSPFADGRTSGPLGPSPHRQRLERH